MTKLAKKTRLFSPPDLGCVINWPSQSAHKWSANFLETAPKQSNIDAIIAVGSAVRDVAECADIDLVVIYNSAKPIFNNPPIDVDIRVYKRDDVETLLSKGQDLLGWAIRLGCIVYELNHYWTILRSSWMDRLPFPSAEEARSRAVRAKKLYRDLSAVGDADAANEQQVTMLTHLARARLIEANIFPASRPELEEQLRGIGENELAQELSGALSGHRAGKETRGSDLYP